MSDDLHRKSLAELARLIAARQLSPRELVDATLARIDAENPRLNALVTVCAERAQREADALADEVQRGRLRGPLHGIPLAVKDLTDTQDLRTTYGSSLFRDHVPRADAEPIARLRAAGAIIVAKANTHEFACGTTTNNPHYGPTHNPWRSGHVPGGSSGGSGAAVAAGLVPLSTGSDTGGSIRIPAALCGCVGIKPSFGRVSLRGTFPMASTCDHVGPLARTARDCAIALQAMSGYDPADPWSRRFPPEDLAGELDRSLAGLRVALAPRFRPVAVAPGVAAGLERAVTALSALGAEINEVELPSGDEVIEAGGIAIVVETYAEHAQRLACHSDAYGADVRFQLELGAHVSGAALVRAQKTRERIARQVENLLGIRADVLVLPTVPMEAPAIGEELVTLPDGTAAPVMSALAAFTLLHNVTRLPTVAVPVGLGPGGLPTSVQVTAAFGADNLALAVAHQLESAVWPHDQRWPR